MKKHEEAVEENIKAFNLGQYFLLAIAQNLQFNKHPKQIYPKKPFDLSKDKNVKLTQKEYVELRKAQMMQMEKMFNTK